MIKVLLVDDEQLIRSGMAILLSSFGDIEIVGQAANGQEAYDFCLNHQVDVILMDIRMEGMNGIEGTRMIKEIKPDINILMLTTFQDSEYIMQAMENGASGYLLKDSDYHDIYEGIKIAYKGNVVIDGSVSHKIISSSNKEPITLSHFEEYGITQRELDIIIEVGKGLNNQEIADKLFLSVGTIKNNISNILDKLELRDRTQLAIFAHRHRIV